ncbi:OpgC domain-containing protein [Bradyrhizobium sp.]|uniref:OpgC domain-containing protein n=1 Tax=Bradyrhizobium sp. TaxID=376 RepID=UPI003C72725F
MHARPAPAIVLSPAVSLPAGERELRIDLFRGLALWLIFIDHMSPDLLTWFTIRSYGFSDAAEIFIFISGYTAAFVYGRIMREAGFVIASARILRRAWQIYVANVFLFTIFFAEIVYAARSFNNPLYSDEMGVNDFLKHPNVAIVQALLLRFRLLNMDVLPLYVLLMFFLPWILRLMQWRADVTLALSVGLYGLAWKYDLYLTSYPNGFWAFNPFFWQLLFVFGAWCALGGARRMSRLILSPVTQWIAIGYLLAAFSVTMTWYFPQLGFLMPRRLEQWIYPISKTDLDVLRFAHFLALAAIAVRLVPPGWPGLKSPWLRPLILCGQHSLEIFCLGVFLAFVGYFILIESSAGLGLHFLAAFFGVLIMTAVAWLNTWYKRSDRESRSRTREFGGNADIVGGG